MPRCRLRLRACRRRCDAVVGCRSVGHRRTGAWLAEPVAADRARIHPNDGGSFAVDMSSEWWHNAKHPGADTVTIGELVEGLAEVGDQAIPYGRITRRAHTVYSSEFRSWGDLAGASVSSLLGRRRGGIGTVQALVAAAREAVAVHRSEASGEHADAPRAVQRLIDRLSERDRIMLAATVWALTPQSQPQVATRLGVHTASVQRNLPRARERFSELLSDPLHRDVVAFAEQLRTNLGPLAPVEAVAAEMSRLAVDWPSVAADLLLHVAGPYVWRDRWLEERTRAIGGRAAAVVDDALAEGGAPTTETLRSRLTGLGMPAHLAEAYLASREDLRHHGDRWVRKGRSAADQAEAFLHLRGQPASIADIIDGVGDGYGRRAVSEALYADARFVRASRQTWALAHWGVSQYEGIAEAIARRIDTAGGPLDVDTLVNDVCTAFPDVAESSIRRYLTAPAFVVDFGRVRRRTPDDAWPRPGPLNTARGAYRGGRSEIRLATAVTSEALRGSGRALHAAVAAALGVHPGQRHTFTGAQGTLTVGWRMSSNTGPHMGSVRLLAVAAGATLGDTLVLAFNANTSTVTATRLSRGQRGHELFEALLGRRVSAPLPGLARALECRPSEVADVLTRRGDDAVLAELRRNLDL